MLAETIALLSNTARLICDASEKAHVSAYRSHLPSHIDPMEGRRRPTQRTEELHRSDGEGLVAKLIELNLKV